MSNNSPILDYFVCPQSQIVNKSCNYNQKYYYTLNNDTVDISVAYLNINGNANQKLRQGSTLWHLLYDKLHQPDILIFVEVKSDAKLNKQFTKLRGYGTYFIPPKVTPKQGLSNGM